LAQPRPASPPNAAHAAGALSLAGCAKTASQAGWGCRFHFFKLTPDLRNRLFLAHRAELRANGRLGQAWNVVADEAALWALDRVGHQIVDRRQPELPL
jgi:hypothetical protein